MLVSPPLFLSSDDFFFFFASLGSLARSLARLRKKKKVLLDDAISSVELVNCQRVQVQVRGSVPSVAVDKTDGFLCYLGKDGMETTFVTSKVRVRFCFALLAAIAEFLLSSSSSRLRRPLRRRRRLFPPSFTLAFSFLFFSLLVFLSRLVFLSVVFETKRSYDTRKPRCVEAWSFCGAPLLLFFFLYFCL